MSSSWSLRARQLLEGRQTLDDLSPASFAADLLPSWYDDWVIVERERLRQIRVHALEELSRRLAAGHRYGDAIDAALAAIAADPLRESAHRRLIEAHLAEGNVSEAIRQYADVRWVALEPIGHRTLAGAQAPGRPGHALNAAAILW